MLISNIIQTRFGARLSIFAYRTISASIHNSGVEYPVHPIDTIAATSDGAGGVICFSGFPFSDGFSNSEDLLIGDSFLRNVYSLYDYGSFLNESTTPFIQLLSVSHIIHFVIM